MKMTTKAIASIGARLLLLGTLVGFAAPARADRIPDPFASESWMGTWTLTTRASYSTCSDISVGDVSTVDLTISIAKSRWVGRSQSKSGGKAIRYKKVQQRRGIPPVLSLRSGTNVGLDLWPTGPGTVQGRKVFVRHVTSYHACAVVYEISGTSGKQAQLRKPGQGATGRSRLKLGRVDDLSLSDLDPKDVEKRIRSEYLSGIKYCHGQALRSDPMAQGKLSIRFTVNPNGAVSKASVKGFGSTIESCVEAQTALWTFTQPKSKGRPTSADFSVPLLLKPASS